jgi:benzoylformate decarboxylase
VAQSDSLGEVAELADLLGAPVWAEGIASRATFPSTHPLFQGHMQRLSTQIREILKQHDVLFSIGGDLFTQSLPTNADPVPTGVKIVHLDTDAWELGKNQPADIAMLGEPKATLPELTDRVRQLLGREGTEHALRRRDAVARNTADKLAAVRREAEDLGNKSPIRALALMKTIGDLLPNNAVVVEEALSSADRMRNLIPSLDSKSWFGMRGGGIGWGLPAAVGVKLALPERPVVALIGDGSSMYTMQALWTAAHCRVGTLVFVILNNTSYRILKQRMNAMREYAAQADHYPAMDLVEPTIDFVGLAASLGVKGNRAGTLDEVRELLSSALHRPDPFLIDVALDRSFKPV